MKVTIPKWISKTLYPVCKVAVFMRVCMLIIRKVGGTHVESVLEPTDQHFELCHVLAIFMLFSDVAHSSVTLGGLTEIEEVSWKKRP